MAVGPVRESCPLGVGRFAELRVPNPPDFLAFIADDLAERRQEIAALHTLQKRLDTIARSDGQQIPADSFVSWPRDCSSCPEADFGELTSLICETITGPVPPEAPERRLR
jgi:hypothetical protein